MPLAFIDEHNGVRTRHPVKYFNAMGAQVVAARESRCIR